jgi:predicted DNA repair protein MutK
MEAITLAVVGVGITIAVYGAVALIVKMDDIGLRLAADARTALGRGLGTGLVKGMPKLMAFLSTVGTLAMLWVGGQIITHGLDVLGYPAIYKWIVQVAEGAAQAVPEALAGFTGWLVTAGIDGVIGLVLGMIVIPVATRVIGPVVGKLTGKAAAH